MRDAVLLFCLRIERREEFKYGHNKLLPSIRKREVGWLCSQPLDTWLFFVFLTDCCQEVEHVTRKIRREKEVASIIREKLKKELAHHVWKYSIPEERRWASKKYQSFTFVRETVRDWKTKY